VVRKLLDAGADQAIVNSKGETAADVAAERCKVLLGAGTDELSESKPADPSSSTSSLGFTPSYLQNPEFFYAQPLDDPMAAASAYSGGEPIPAPSRPLHPRDAQDTRAPVLAPQQPRPAAAHSVMMSPAVASGK